MNKNIMKNALLFGAALMVGTSCTGDFEEINTNPYELSDNQVAMSDLFNEAQLSVYYNQSNGNWEYQLIQNLNADLYSGYFAIPTAFNGGPNNDNYFMMNGWNSYTLSYMLLHVIKPMTTLAKIENLADDFAGIGLILKVAGAHKMVDTYGPCPYTQAMQGGLSVDYDSEEVIYTQMLEELKEATSKLTSWLDANGGKDDASRLSWDEMCGKSQKTWLQFGNTLRLRLAMRIAMAAPTLAKQHGEEAINNKYGLLTDTDVEVEDGNTRNPLSLIARDYNDCSVSANYETILKGYNDPRLAATVLPVGWGGKGDIVDMAGNALGYEGQIKGIRNGLSVDGSNYKMYSIVYTPESGGPYSTDVPLPIMNRAESYFLMAEACLRNWNVTGTAEQWYNDGIRASFESVTERVNNHSWTTADAMKGADVEAYIQGTSIPVDYVDPHNSANNINAVNIVPVKFMTAGSMEDRLQQIITQKWIAGFPEGLNAWAEYRRTGYPKLFPIPESNCNVQAEYLGGSQSDLVKMGIRRLPFSYSERSSNPKGLSVGQGLLSTRGGDKIDTRIWWDTGKNF